MLCREMSDTVNTSASRGKLGILSLKPGANNYKTLLPTHGSAAHLWRPFERLTLRGSFANHCTPTRGVPAHTRRYHAGSGTRVGSSRTRVVSCENAKRSSEPWDVSIMRMSTERKRRDSRSKTVPRGSMGYAGDSRVRLEYLVCRSGEQEEESALLSTNFLRGRNAKSIEVLFAFDLAKSCRIAFCACFLHRKEKPNWSRQTNLQWSRKS